MPNAAPRRIWNEREGDPRPFPHGRKLWDSSTSFPSGKGTLPARRIRLGRGDSVANFCWPGPQPGRRVDRGARGPVFTGAAAEMRISGCVGPKRDKLSPFSAPMAVVIRLRREGNKNRPFYRIVVTDSRARRDGSYLEQVGTYDPKQEGENFKMDLGRVTDWMGKGAKPSETVASMIKKAKAKAG